MLRNLRLRLTLLYTLVALGLVVFIGGGSYFLITQYFQGITDLALRHKMTHEFHLLAAPIPDDLSTADRDWSILRGEFQPFRQQADEPSLEDEEDEEDEENENASIRSLPYDAELAAIFVFPLNSAGQLLFNPNVYELPTTPDQAALQAALATGSDLRTITTGDGERIRLLTYRLTRNDGPAALQLGRVLSDQERLLGQLLVGLGGLGSISLIVLGLGSWWLAGRSIRPAELAWKRQQNFIASASHELRTPLTLMRASAEVAQRGVAPEDVDQQELLADVISEADHMRRLVDDLLTLSRLDSNQLKIEPQRVELPALLNDVQRQIQRVALERGVRIEQGSIAGAVSADPDRLRQVLLILLDNALRYTPAGGAITLAATPHGRMVQIAIADTGSGIATEHLPFVFDRFYRVDTARSAGSGNLGLGLSIAKSLIVAHHGNIYLESAPGQGTRAVIELPHA
jgi:signal transduction histidine kinase